MKAFAQKKFYKLKNSKSEIELFLTGMTQVFFVAINTYFLSQSLYTGVVISSFMISMIWSYNVKRLVFGSLYERMFYALGAALGSVTGLFIGQLIY
jgi:hypothetical protein